MTTALPSPCLLSRELAVPAQSLHPHLQVWAGEAGDQQGFQPIQSNKKVETQYLACMIKLGFTWIFATVFMSVIKFHQLVMKSSLFWGQK